MNEHDNDKVEAIRREILAYLAAHPHAADTAEGAFAWWIDISHTFTTVEQVREVLEQLAIEGRIERVAVTGGRVIYGAEVATGSRRSRDPT